MVSRGSAYGQCSRSPYHDVFDDPFVSLAGARWGVTLLGLMKRALSSTGEHFPCIGAC